MLDQGNTGESTSSSSAWKGSWNERRYSRCVPPRRLRARGHIEQLRSGSYRAVVYVGIDPLTRKERYLTETANSYAQAKVALTRLQREVDEEAHLKTMQHVSVMPQCVPMVSCADGRGAADAMASVSRRLDQGVIDDAALEGDSADALSGQRR
jgi:hypothetical protein